MTDTVGVLTVLVVFIGMVVKYVLTWCRQEEIRVYFCGIQPIVQFVYNLKDFFALSDVETVSGYCFSSNALLGILHYEAKGFAEFIT